MYCVGAITSFSIAAVPAAAEVQQSSAEIWAELYKRGAASMPKFAAGTACAYLFAAYGSRGAGGSWGSYLGSAACVLSIVPFTLTVMKRTNEQLHEEADNDSSEEEIEASVVRVKSLLDRWITLNFIRGLLPLAGTILGSLAFLRDAF
ncbi:hypothetical protein Trco_003532 [Trichoderma cornu-damae]|uniref:DUF1772-domain-containing protein n=1 Tax=Trichoderma cornu-damae TaxID=654480 RepID=A0A9P8TW29_9HYPO|nr:hypothetical protein Trco_003532 [Trichoderma cornu-damae]